MHLFPLSTGGRRLLQVWCAVLALTIVVLTPDDAWTSSGDDDPVATTLAEAPNPFNGSFWEFSLRGGPLLSSFDGASNGWTTDVGLRNSYPFYLADHRLSYGFSRYSVDDHAVDVHNLHASFAIHPLYLTLLSQGVFSHFLASLHLELGLGARWAQLSGPVHDDSSIGFGPSLGAGFDLPLTEPNRGRSLWINALYRRTWTTAGFDDGSQTERLHDHGFFLGLAWRNNGILW